MTRGSYDLLPYCPRCGQYKGIGDCKNPNCGGISENGEPIDNKTSTCAVCSSSGAVSCSVCGQNYCMDHSAGADQIELIFVDQHVGTCDICGKIVCEYCWILNKDGKITCLNHLESKRNRN